MFNYDESKPKRDFNGKQGDNRRQRNYNQFEATKPDGGFDKNSILSDEEYNMIPVSKEDSLPNHHKKSKFDSSDKRSFYAPRSIKSH